MKMLLVGANGQIGQHLVKLFQESKEHEVVAMVRNEEQATKLKEKGIETVLCNLEGTVEEIAKAATGCDGIIFSAGSGASTGPDKTLLVDLDGAAKCVEAAEMANANRFIMVSALQAHRRENWAEVIKPYYVAKHYADKIVAASNLNYTILRPGGLINEPSIGKVTIAENLGGGTIPREDVAKTIYASLTEEATYRKSFDLLSGETPIAEALKEIN